MGALWFLRNYMARGARNVSAFFNTRLMLNSPALEVPGVGVREGAELQLTDAQFLLTYGHFINVIYPYLFYCASVWASTYHQTSNTSKTVCKNNVEEYYTFQVLTLTLYLRN